MKLSEVPVLNKIVERRTLPLLNFPSDRQFFEHELQTELPSCVLREYHQVNIFSSGLVIDGYSLLRENIADQLTFDLLSRRKSRFKLLIKRLIFRINRSRVSGRTLLITDNWSQGYFHWMLDCLPKLLVLEKLARLNHCTLLLPKDFEAMGFIKESLTLFKLEVRFLQSPITRVDNLITLSNVAKTGNYRKYLIQSLREKLEDTLDLFDGNHELIYISRSQAQKRKIANESSYTNQLESLGFKIVIFEKLTWIDQIRLMAQAKVAVSIHGAGLTNIVSMKKGSALVEIRREGDAHNNCYFSLADALSIEYYYVLARSVSIDSEISSDSDLFVNVDTLLSKLHQIIN